MAAAIAPLQILNILHVRRKAVRKYASNVRCTDSWLATGQLNCHAPHCTTLEFAHPKHKTAQGFKPKTYEVEPKMIKPCVEPAAMGGNTITSLVLNKICEKGPL